MPWLGVWSYTLATVVEYDLSGVDQPCPTVYLEQIQSMTQCNIVYKRLPHVAFCGGIDGHLDRKVREMQR
jgi:hypothetical protein